MQRSRGFQVFLYNACQYQYPVHTRLTYALCRIATSNETTFRLISSLPKSPNDPRNLLARSSGSSAVTSFNPSGSSSLVGGASSPLSSICFARTTNRKVIWYTRKRIKRCLDSPFCELASSLSCEVSTVALCAAFFALFSAFLDFSPDGSAKRDRSGRTRGTPEHAKSHPADVGISSLKDRRRA